MPDSYAVLVELAVFVLGCAVGAVACMRWRAARCVRDAEARAATLIAEAEQVLRQAQTVQARALRIAARLIVAAGELRRGPPARKG